MLVMSWSDANTEYRWYTPSSLVAELEDPCWMKTSEVTDIAASYISEAPLQLSDQRFRAANL
jgi:hypothetical protein